jgi:hypothetical protein
MHLLYFLPALATDDLCILSCGSFGLGWPTPILYGKKVHRARSQLELGVQGRALRFVQLVRLKIALCLAIWLACAFYIGTSYTEHILSSSSLYKVWHWTVVVVYSTRLCS